MKNKKPRSPETSKKVLQGAVGLVLLFFLQALWHAKDKSATYDELGHLTTAFLLSHTDHLDYDIHHPPFLRYLFAIPLWFLQPARPMQPLPLLLSDSSLEQKNINRLYSYGFEFLYANRVSAERLIFSSRIVNILLGCLLGSWVFLWAKKLYGESEALFSLGLFAFCPNLIAHSSLVTTDLGGVAFAVGFLYSLSLLTETQNWQRILFSGIMLGLAQIAKFSNIFLISIFVLFFTIQRKMQGERWGKIALPIFSVLAISWLVLCAGYKFEQVFSPHTLPAKDWELLGWGSALENFYRFLPLPDSFLKGFLSVVYHNGRGHGAFLLGDYSTTGWWYYFPVAFLAKSPTALLILTLLWLRFFLPFFHLPLRKEEEKGELHRNGFWRVAESASAQAGLRRDEILLLCSLLFFFGTAMTSKINIGLRHVLIAFPILYILLGKLTHQFSWKKTKTKVAVTSLFLLLSLEVLSVSPHYLAFFNRLCGGPGKGIKILSDSNIDWGQDLKNLASFLKKEGNPELLLSYFGTAVPQYYGIRYQSLPTAGFLPPSEHTNSPQPQKEFLAISVTNLQATYFLKRDLYAWLLNKKPVAKIGYSIYVYEVTHDLESQQKILEIYKLTGEINKFLRQVKRVQQLQSRFIPSAI